MMDLSPDPDVFTQEAQPTQDQRLLVKFYIQPMQDRDKTAELGRAVFKDVEFIDIRAPGSRDSVARPARQSDIDRFPRHYEAFKKRIEMPLEGTPLAEWPLMTRSMVEELAFLGIKTVEALAQVSDTHVASVRGLGSFKRQAQEWLADADDDAGVTKLTARLEETEAQLAARDKMIADLSARLAALEEDAAKEATSPPSPVSSPDLKSALDESSDVAESSSPEPTTDGRRRRRRRKVLENSV